MATARRTPTKKSAPKQSTGGTITSVMDKMQGELNSMFGKGTASRLSETSVLSRVDDWVSSRSIVVDAVLRGGRPVGSSLIPFGRQVEISGPNNSGKTSLCAQIAAEVQSQNGVVVVTDTEERIDEPYWQKLGVNTKQILHLTTDSLSDCFNKQYRALEAAKNFAEGRPVLLLWDSLGGTKGSDVEITAKSDPMEEANKFGMRRGKIISDGMELINTIVSKTRACYLYTNHEYTKMNVKFGSPRETRGGNKPKYFATVRLQLTPVGTVKSLDSSGNDQIIGQRVQVKALKNSMAGILQTREAILMAHKGFVNEYSVFEVGKKLGAIETSGSWTTWHTSSGEEIKFQGFNGFESLVMPHPEYGELVSQVTATM